VKEIIVPHGGVLVNRIVDEQELLDQAQEFPTLIISSITFSDLVCIATGIFSPLTGFLTEEDYHCVLNTMHLVDGTVWPLPITLPVPKERAKEIRSSMYLTLKDKDELIIALVRVKSLYEVNLEDEALKVYGTIDEKHPGVARLKKTSSLYLGGEIYLLNLPKWEKFLEYNLTPVQTRLLFCKKGWKHVVGFQTRNPVHRAHEYILKSALETVDGLFFNPLVGETKQDDIQIDVRMKSYEVVLREYFPKNRFVFSVFPAAMRYAGPREAVFHAITRKNYGCTHFIVGRDHAGVGKYYGTYDAQKIFEQFDPKELGIQPLFFEHSFYCTKCDQMASYKTCPHSSSYHITLSGTNVRSMLSQGHSLPPQVSRPEVVKVLKAQTSRKN
jgi:sulfate adenylyltransferase